MKTNPNVSHSRYIQKQRNLVAQQEEHLDKLKQDYKKRVDSVREQGEDEISTVKIDNNIKVAEDIRKTEERLEEIKKGLELTKLKVDKEKEIIQNNGRQRVHELDQMNKENLELKTMKNIELLKDQNHRQSQEFVKLKDTHIDQMSQKRIDNSTLRQQLERANNLDITSQKENNKRESLTNKLQHDRVIHTQNMDFEKTISKEKQEYERALKDLKLRNKKQFDFLVKNHQILMDTTKQDFKKNYDGLISTHNTRYENLKNVTKDLIEKLKNQFSIEKKTYTDRYSDPFYQPKKITPRIKEKLNSFEISFKVPEHEQGLLNVSGKNRQMKATFSRSFNQQFRTTEGLNQANKAETLIKEFTVSEPIDPSKITKDYKEGHVIFTIAKL